MAQQFTRQISAAMHKGLITEATPLTFPEDATIDELNCTLERNGSRRRRLGAALEVADSLLPTPGTPDTVYHSDIWENAGGKAGNNFVVYQVGETIYFYRANTILSLGRLPIGLNLTPYAINTGDPVGQSRISVTSIRGYLIVCGPDIQSFTVSYSEDEDGEPVLETNVISFFIRDFEYIGDKNTYFDEAPTAGIPLTRVYDTLNSGWRGLPSGITPKDSSDKDKPRIIALRESLLGGIAASLIEIISGAVATRPLPPGEDTAIKRQANKTFSAFLNKDDGEEDQDRTLLEYIDKRSAYPPLTHPWFSGKNSDGNFKVSRWLKVDAASSLTANGSFILNLFDMDRETVSNIDGLNALIPEDNISETGRFSYVTTYAGRAFYTGLQTKRSNSRVYFSRIVEELTDFGKLYQQNDPTSEYMSDLLDNDGGYISIYEAKNIKALQVFGSKLLVFADNGVWAISGVDDVFRATDFIVDKVSEFGLSTVESLVSASGRPYWWSNVGIHTLNVDQNKMISEETISMDTIQSLFTEISATSRNSVTAGYDGLNKRVYWLYSDESAPGSFKNKALIFDEHFGAFLLWSIQSDEGTPYLVGVTPAAFTTQYLVNSPLKFTVANVNGEVGFGEFSDRDFIDWGKNNYSSYFVTGWRFQKDLTLEKNAPFVTTLMYETTEGVEYQDDGSYKLIREPSCFISAYWDFKPNAATKPQQVYRRKDTLVPSDSFDVSTLREAMSTRLKCRGSGKCLSLKFDSEDGKDFHVIGFETIDARNTQP